VNDERELGRWLDEGSDAPAGLKRLLGGARDALGTSDEVLRLQASLARALGPAAGFGDDSPVSGLGRVAGQPAATANLAKGGASPLKLWLAGGVIAGGVAALALSNVAPWSVASWNTERAPQPSSAPSVEASAPRVEPTSGAPSASSVEPVLEAPPVVAERVPAAPRVARPRAESEAALLQRAQAALATDPARALVLTREHRRRFPQGSLSQEREVIAIEALKRVGAERAAGEKASEFEQRYRGSVHKERVRESVTVEPRSPAPTK
jgi:hypothetical protein